MKKKHSYSYWEKPKMCDPGMCKNCIYLGNGDFICRRGPGDPALVVEGWKPTEQAGRCRRAALRP